MQQIKNRIIHASMISALMVMQPFEAASSRAASWKEQLQKVWNARYSVDYPNWAPYALIGGLGTLALAAVIYRYVPVFNIKTAKVPMMQSTQEEHKKEQEPSTAAALEAKAKEEAKAITEQEEKKLAEVDPEEKTLVDALRKLDETMANVYVYLRNLQKNEPAIYKSFTDDIEKMNKISNRTPLDTACQLVWGQEKQKAKIAVYFHTSKDIMQWSKIFSILEYFTDEREIQKILPVFIAKNYLPVFISKNYVNVANENRGDKAQREFFKEYRELFFNQLTQEQWNLIKSKSICISWSLSFIHKNFLNPFFLYMQKKTTILKTIAAIKKRFAIKGLNYAIPWLEAIENEIKDVVVYPS